MMTWGALARRIIERIGLSSFPNRLYWLTEPKPRSHNDLKSVLNPFQPLFKNWRRPTRKWHVTPMVDKHLWNSYISSSLPRDMVLIPTLQWLESSDWCLQPATNAFCDQEYGGPFDISNQSPLANAPDLTKRTSACTFPNKLDLLIHRS